MSPLDLARSTRLCAAVLLALGAPALCHATALAQLDRSETTPDRPITLSIISDSTSGSAQPDLSPLRQDFQILGTSTGSETTIINGRRSDQLRWDVSLQPKHAGRIEIPAITVGSERTSVLELNVVQASPEQRATDATHAFVEADTNATHRSPYVQQQIPYAVRLFYDDNVTPAQLDAPAPANALVSQLGADKHFTAIRHGHGYNVIERDYAIEPQTSGTLVIAPPSFRGTEALAAPISQANPQDPQDPQDPQFARMFANTPFANMPGLRAAFGPGSAFGGDTRPITAQGQQVSLNVKPRPASVQGAWLPAEQLTLHDSWAGGAPALKVGEPATRVITIEAKGLLASQIPSLSIAALAKARVYPDSPENQSHTDGQSVYGTSKQSITYIPTQTGAMDIASVDLTWWDVQANVLRHATLPALHLQIAPGSGGATSSEAPPVAAPTPTAEPRTTKAAPQARRFGWTVKPLLVGTLAVAALAALLAYILRRRRSAKGAVKQRTEPAASPRKAALVRALRDACQANAAQASAHALLDLARLEWPGDPPHSLSALAARQESGRDEVLALDRCLYGNGGPLWNGSALWQAVRDGLRPAPNARSSKAPALEPLYPRATS